MRASELLEKHADAVRSIAARYELEGLRNLRVFGSVAKGLDTERSDIDFLIDAEPGATYFTIGGMYFELEELLGSKIDLVTTDSIPDSVKPQILQEAKPI